MDADDVAAQMNGWLDRCYPPVFRDVVIFNEGVQTLVVWTHPNSVPTGLHVWHPPHPHGGFYLATVMYGRAWLVVDSGAKLTDNAWLDPDDLAWSGRLPHDPDLAAKFLIAMSHHVLSEPVSGGSA